MAALLSPYEEALLVVSFWERQVDERTRPLALREEDPKIVVDSSSPQFRESKVALFGAIEKE